MAEESVLFELEGLDELFMLDLTDDFWEMDLGDEIGEAVQEGEEETPDKRFQHVTKDELVVVLLRLSDPDCNIPDEKVLADTVLALIKQAEQEEKVSSFLASIRESFSSFYDSVRVKKKQEREIRIERKFLESSEERKLIEQKWKEIIACCGILSNKYSKSIFEHVLLHFWTVRQTVSKEIPGISLKSTATTADETELDAIRYHGGWAVKRSRDLIKAVSDASAHLVLKQSSNNSTEVLVDPKQALELIKILGNDEKVGNEYNFVLQPEVTQFFVLLHDITDSYFSVSSIDDQIIINCLKEISVHRGLRVAWETICKRAFPIAVQIAVLHRVCTMFLKSKQQIIREKLNLKPQKGSVALRQDIKKPKAKKKEYKPAETPSNGAAGSKTPGIIKQLQENFGKPEIVAQCLKEIGKVTDPQLTLNQLTGKQLSRILRALGQPARDGKGKAKQIAVLLPVITADTPLNFKYPDKLLQE